MNKKGILLICLIMCFISFQAVSAVEIDNNGTQDNTLAVSNNVNNSNEISTYSLPDNDVLQSGSGNGGSFSDLQADISTGGLITLNGDYIYSSSDTIVNGIVITQDTTIDGYGVTIDAKGKTRIFDIASGITVTLNGITFINANATGSGGSIYSEGTLVVNDCTFINNSAYSDGGAIAFMADNDSINRCTFMGNIAGCDGGAIKVIGNHTTIINCTFERCNSTEDGGSLYVSGEYCGLVNSTFKYSNAGDDGGAIYWEGDHGNIYNITCSNNRGISLSGSSNGGTICLTGDNITVTKSTFKLTSALIAGGAIFATGNYINITESSFERCNVSHNINDTGKNYANGGGSVYVLGNHTNIINCIFDRNNGREGAIMFIHGNYALIDNVTTLHSFALNGGAIYIAGNNTIISNSEVTMTNATLNGGAIYIEGINTTISNSTLGMVFSSNDGGSIYILGANATIVGSNFFKSNTTMAGGSIYVKGSNAKILKSNFTQSHAQVGGVIFVNGTNTIINQSSFTMCSADLNGGSLYVAGNNATIEKSSFDKNNVTGEIYQGSPRGHGGSIYIQGNFTKISDSNFTMDIAVLGDGAAIYVGGINTTISNAYSSITRSVNGHGGTIYVNGANTTIMNSNLGYSNSAKEGGAIYLNGFNANIINTTVYRSYSELDGGAVYIKANNATILNSDFSMNNASQSGGAIYIYGDYANVINSTFDRTYSLDVSKGGGGAIYVKGNYATIKGSNFTTNDAKFYGGAIYILGNYIDVSDSNFDKSSASRYGGAIYIKGAYAIINASNFIKSSTIGSPSRGGAIYVEGAYADIIASSFTQCTSRDDAGGVYILGAFTEIINSTFTKCESKNAGGLFISGSNATVIGSNFTENLVSGDGGALYSIGFGSKVYNSTFINNRNKANTGAGSGGAIYWQGGSMDDLIEGCYFEGNKAQIAGGIYMAKNAAAETSGTIRFCNFTYNSGFRSGAVGWSSSNNALIEYCYFGHNTAVKHAAAIYAGAADAVGSKFKIYNCSFEDNVVRTGIGGALSIRISGTEVISCNFTDNMASAGGSIVIKEWGVSDVVIDKCNFTNSRSLSDGATEYGSAGGAIAVWGDDVYNPGHMTDNITVTNSNFINCYARAYSGGAIDWSSADGRLINCTFINCSAPYGGSIRLESTNTVLINITIINSTSTQYGAGIFVGTVHLKSTTGRDTQFDATDCNLENITIINTRVNDGDGAAIYIENSANRIILNNISIYNSTASNNGGGMYVAGRNIAISNINFTNNSALNGGAMYTTGTKNPVTIINISFVDNHADNDGGAIYSNYLGSTIFYCNFTNTTAGGNGGAIVLARDNQEVGFCNFDSNNATGNGGAIYVGQVNQIQIHDSTFKNSYAHSGGAVYNTGSSGATLYLVNNTFIKNIASHNGGAVLYIVEATAANPIFYRDYMNFDGRGDINSATGRTTLTMKSDNDIYTNRIYECLFEDNVDYELLISSVPDLNDTSAVIYIQKPKGIDKESVRIFINLTDSTGTLFRQLVINSTNYDDYFNEYTGEFAIPFDDLIAKETYNVTVFFKDKNYLNKTGNSSFTVSDVKRLGQFELLQLRIDNAIRMHLENLTLDRPYTFTPELDTGCVVISGPIRIIGNGYTINALNYCRIFNITSDNVTLENLVLINGNATGNRSDNVSEGGAIYWSGSNGAIINSTIKENVAEYGGGIFYASSAVDSRIVNCVFELNNASERGGAIDCNASRMNLTNTQFKYNYADYGAALCREVNATGGFGYNNSFISNHAKSAGAALAWINSSSNKIDTYYFKDNTAGNGGGAIYVGEGSGNCEIYNSEFINNYVINLTDGHGGAIEWYAKEGLVYNSSFSENHAYDGGAIYVGSNSGKINVTKSSFYKNFANTNGGAISLNASSITINTSNFFNNTAQNGGAMFVGGEGFTNYVISSNFSGNIASNKEAFDGRGGAIDWVASSGHLINVTFSENYADYGGAVYMGGNSSSSQITICRFENNHAKYTGGAIDWNSEGGQLFNNIFVSNYAQYGAALCRGANATGGYGYNNTFISNHAYIAGAALGWMGSVGISITNYTFINNSADVSGAAIYVSSDSHNCSILDCNFENNYVTNVTFITSDPIWEAWDGEEMQYFARETDDESLIGKIIIKPHSTTYYYSKETGDSSAVGGAINILAANATIKNTHFKNNTANLGGAIYVGTDKGNTNIDNSEFTANTAYEHGGAINLHASGVSVNNTKFTDNVAHEGGAMYVSGEGFTNFVLNSVFTGNNATNGHGGAIEWVSAEGHIEFSNFTRNSADYGGAIFFNGESHNSSVINVRFEGNNATYNGGAIDWDAKQGKLYNTVFISNYAGEYGAALCRESDATGGSGENNTFIANHAGIAGAALAWLGVDGIYINDYHFIDNTAGSSGAAIYVALGSDNCIINNSDFRGNNITNTTGGHGGAIDIVANHATVINSNFTNNHAFYGGAIFAGEFSGDTNISNVIFTRNGAVVDGGAIQIRGSGVTLNDTYFYSNYAGSYGGGIYVGGSGITNVVYYSVFEDNEAGDHGGAIAWHASAGEIRYSNFTKNSAIYGGAIYLNGISTQSELSHLIFINNTAIENGGAIDCNATFMNLTHTQFISNYAKYGAALCREANATGGFGINNTFISNHAYISGAALAWLGVDNININNYTFINNTADRSAGAIYVSDDSDYCVVHNSTFENNYVTDVKTGHGGAIDWRGTNGLIYDNVFKDSFAVNGGTIFAHNQATNLTIRNSSFISSRGLGEGGSITVLCDNVAILDSNFTYALALEKGGIISAHDMNNLTINNCMVLHSVGAGYVDSSLTAYGEGGAIFLENITLINISNSGFYEIESHGYGGAISAINCNDSVLNNLTFAGGISIRSGGAISWINSTNLTINSSSFTSTASAFGGGAIFLDNINDAVICNSNFNSTSTPWGNGGAIYLNGYADIDNCTFANYDAMDDYAGAIFLYAGNFNISNSKFDGPDAIWVNVTSTAYLINNTIAGSRPNKNITYLDKPYDARYNKYDYSVWNDGILYLEGNTFDYIIFNNGTIKSQTVMYVLDNKTWELTWNDNFKFWANITDDNNNTIISVDSLDTYNDHPEFKNYTYYMPYNMIDLTLSLQGIFVISGNDTGLEQCDMHPGTVKVKMETYLNITCSDLNKEIIIVTATITTQDNANSNYTIENQTIWFNINGKSYNATIVGGVAQWNIANSNLTLNHLNIGSYTISVSYDGDDYHWGSANVTSFTLFARSIWIQVHADDIVFGQTLIINVTSNATNAGSGRIVISINGRNITGYLRLNSNGSYVLNYTEILEPGNYALSVVFNNDTYYAINLNSSSFNVFKLNTTVDANATASIKGGEKETIIVQVNENYTKLNATGFIKITIDGEEYYARLNSTGGAKINIYDLTNGTYSNIKVEYLGDSRFNENLTLVTFTVGLIDNYDMHVIVDNITYGENATIYVVLPGDVTNNVTICVNDDVYDNVVVNNGIAKLIIPNLDVGNYLVNVTYNGDNSYLRKDINNTRFNVGKSTSYIMNVTAADVEVGVNTTITVHVPKDATGSVTIWVNGTKLTNSSIVNGVVTFSLNKSVAGKYVINASLNDTRYAERNVTNTFFVFKLVSEMNITVINKDNISVGDTVKVIVSLPSAIDGENVSVEINSKKYTNITADGVAVFYIPSLAYGNKTVVAIYEGNNKYLANSTTANFTVSKRISSVNVTVDASYVGCDVVINVTVPHDAKGYVIVSVDGVNYTVNTTSGRGSITLGGLGNITHIVNVTFTGDDKYLSSINSTVFGLFKIDSFISVEADNITRGDSAVVRITVPQNATGNVTVVIIGDDTYVVPVVNGTAILIVPDLTVANYTVNVVYNGDDKYLSSVNSTVFAVDKIVCQVNVVDLGNGTVVVVVPVNATGSVTVKVGSSEFSGVIDKGVAGVDLDGLTPGVKNIEVTYSGDSNYTNRTVNSVAVIPKLVSSVIVNVSDIYVGDIAKIVVGVPSNATGTVIIEINGKSYTNGTVDGNATFYVGGLTYGNKTVAVGYSGDENYTAGSTTANFTVFKRISQVNVTVSSPIDVGENANISVKLQDNVTGYVSINVGGNNYTVNLTNGQGSVEIRGLKNNTYNVYVTYLGDDQYLSCINNTQLIKVNKVASNINLTVSENALISNGSDVNITIESDVDATGKVIVVLSNSTGIIDTYTVYVNEGRGLLHLDSPAIGLYNITATYRGDDKYLTSENRTSFKVYANKGDLIVDSQSVFVNENNTINITISGKHNGEVTIIISDINGEIINQNVTLTSNNTLSKANLTLPLLDAGKYYVNALYKQINGTEIVIYTGSSEFEVYKLPSQITISEMNSPIYVGDNETVKLKVDLDSRANDGNISVFVNGVEYKTNTSNLSVVISNLNASTYDVLVIYHGNKWYNKSNTTGSFNVVRHSTPISINVTNSNVGGVEQINVTLPSDATGQILLDIDSKHYYANITDGIAQFNITDLNAGEFRVNATYLGDYKYLANSTYSNVIISKQQPAFVINGTNIQVGFEELITFKTSENITDAVNVELNGINYTAFIHEGKGNLTIHNLSAGRYDVILYFTGNANYLNATAKNNFTVSQATPAIDIDVLDITYGDDESVIVHVGASGSVTLRIDSISYINTSNIENGKAVFIIKDLLAGNYTVNATYNGNINLTKTSKQANFTVAKATPQINVLSQDILYGEIEKVTASVNATGNVTFKLNGREVTVVLEEGNGGHGILRASITFNDKASVDIADLAVGNYIVEITYNGNDNYEKVHTTAEFRVLPINTTIDVSVNNIPVWTNEQITVKVNENATGFIRININGENYTENINNGLAIFTIPDLSVGDKTVWVFYDGDNNFTANKTMKTFNVYQRTPTINVVASNISAGQNGDIHVSMPGNATGYVVVVINGTKYYENISNGEAHICPSDLSVGTYTVNVTYYGDSNDNYTSAEVNTKFTVSKLNTTVEIKVDSIDYGDKLNITATVDFNATGSITVIIDENHTAIVHILNGKANWIVDNLAAGTYTLTASYSGDRNFNTNSSSNISKDFEVRKIEPSISIENVTVEADQNATIIIKITPKTTGKINITVNNKKYSGNIDNGLAIITIDTLTPGKYNIIANYYGDKNYTDKSDTFNNALIVTKITTYQMNIDVNDTYVGQTNTIVVNVPEDVTGNVTININGTVLTNASIVNGKATFEVTKNEYGLYLIEATLNDEKYDIDTTAKYRVLRLDIPIDINVGESYVGNLTKITVNVYNDAGENITIAVGGKNYTNTTINGVATFYIAGLTAGNKTIAAIYPGDDKYTFNATTSNFEVLKNPSGVNVTVDASFVGSDVVINLTVPFDALGQVIVSVDGVNYTVSPVNGRGSLVISGLGNVTHVVNVTFVGDDKFLPAVNSTEFGLFKVDSFVSVSADNITVGGSAVVNIAVPVDACGNVTVVVGGESYVVSVVNGTAILIVSGLSVDNYTVNVVYNGDAKYLNSVNSTVFAVNKVVCEISVFDLNNNSVIVVVPVNTTGKVTVKVDGEEFEGVVENSSAVIDLVGVSPGAHNITVVYSGDVNHTGCSVNASVAVKRLITSVDVVVENIFVGDVAKIIVAVPVNASGSVSIEINGRSYTNVTVDGNATFYVGGLAYGNKTVAVVYSGDENYTAVSTTANFTVYKRDSFVNLTVSADRNVTINVTVPSNATGTVVINANGINYALNIVDGEASVTFYNSDASYSINATYLGDDQYSPSVNNTTFNTNKTDSFVLVNAGDIIVGHKAVIEITVPDDASGDVVVSVEGNNYTVSVDNGKATVAIEGLTVGSHTVNVMYLGDAKYLNSTNSTNVVVRDIDYYIAVDVDNVSYGDVVNIIAYTDSVGNVTIKIGNIITKSAMVVDGKAVFNITGLDAGDYEVTAIASNENINASCKFTIYKAVPNIDISVEDIYYGDIAHIIVRVDAPGNVTVKVNGKNITVNLNNGVGILKATPRYDGKASVDVYALDAGKYPVEVIYNGDSNYIISNSSTSFNVYRINTELELNISNFRANETGIISVKINNTNATGIVSIIIDDTPYNVTVENGVANLAVGNLTKGKHSVVAVYEGDNNHLSNWTGGEFNVVALDTSLIVSCEDSDVGENATIIVDVDENATGAVLITVDDKEYRVAVSDGRAILVLDQLPEGSYDVEVEYLGDDIYSNSKNSTKFTISKVKSTMSLDADDINVSDKAIIRITLPDDATGEVIVTVGGENYTVEVGGGQGILIIPDLAIGNYTVDAVYTGDGKYLPNNNSTSFEVSKLVPKVYVVNQGNGSIVVILPDVNSGNVTVNVGDKNYTAEVVDGKAVVNVDDLNPGTQNITVTYLGDETNSEVSVNLTITMPKLESLINIDVEDIIVGNVETVFITVYVNGTGNVTLQIDGESITKDLIDGEVTFVFENLTSGNKTAVAIYNGDDNYKPSYNTTSFVVNKVNSHVSANIDDISVGDNAVVKVSLPYDATGIVLVDIAGVGYYINISNGVGSIEIPNLHEGDYEAHITYLGDDKYMPSTTVITFKVSKVPSYNIPKTDSSTPNKDIIGITLPEDATGTVTITVDGVNYTKEVVNGESIFEIDNLSNGEYEVLSVYSGDDKYLSSTNSTMLVVDNNQNPTPMEVIIQNNTEGEVTKIIVNLPWDASGTVSVAIGNKIYTAPVINGQAIFDIPNLTEGRYEVIVSYSGDDKWMANSTVLNMVVYPQNNSDNQIEAYHNDDWNIGLSYDACGNPIFILMLVILLLTSTIVKRVK